jgi:hypothetical protein
VTSSSLTRARWFAPLLTAAVVIGSATATWLWIGWLS